ncbi:hypothetical protein HPS57_01595 [Prevotella sp. PINT]|jgi:hypothetical protein|uniref:hypothetical protein n=1 Tax=Palleniella intestinalis TaxID=2736291 RepID=UPI0015536B0E|nr:hypothetical protein [Palleniella intestinalis]NPD80678.1 hypothetical protein [Palleniella intestinalis]
MAILRIILYSTQKSQRILYQDADGVMTSEIEKAYFTGCEVEHRNSAWARILVSDKTRGALKILETKYDRSTGRHIRKLHGFISKLADGDVFYYFNEDKASVVERRTACYCLQFPKTAFTPIHNSIFHYYSMLDIYFQFLSYGYDGIEQWIGEEDLNRRVCRFCGCSNPTVSFNKVAHAVQDALGNKLLFCYEECDTCNHNLAPIEDNFRRIMDFRRAMFHIPRKGTTATPKVVGKTFVIKPADNGLPELFIMDEAIPQGTDRTKRFMMHLELKDPLINEDMYKALCKMVIDMLPSTELPHFDNCIKWISANGTWMPDSLPSTLLTVLPTDKVIYPQPVLDIFLNNKGMMPNSPYCTAILWIYDIAYMFVMPFVDVDAGQYKYDKDLVFHWRHMFNLVGIHHWQPQDTNNYHQSTPWVDWNVDLSLPNIHVLSKTEPIFEECFKAKKERPDIDMPPFSKDGIVFNKATQVEFNSLYNGAITDDDLRDLTLHIGGPKFVVDPVNLQVSVAIWVDANDTTDKLSYFKYSYDAVFDIPSFWTYVNMETEEDGSLKSFAFHYDLRDFLYEESLRSVEPLMSKQRIGTPFTKCSLEKMIGCERIFTKAYYMVPYGNDGYYVKVDDSTIHHIGYEE